MTWVLLLLFHYISVLIKMTFCVNARLKLLEKKYVFYVHVLVYVHKTFLSVLSPDASIKY